MYSSTNALSTELRALVERYTNRTEAQEPGSSGVSSWFKKIFN